MRFALTILAFCFLSCTAAKRTAVRSIVIPLDGSKSYDPDGYLAWVKWEQVSGPASTIENPNTLVTSATATTKGTRIYKLTGCDNNGAIRSDTIIIR